MERQLLRANRQRLMDNKPPPLSSDRLPSVGMTDRQSQKQQQDLILMSAERCKSSNGANIAAKNLAQPKYSYTSATTSATSQEVKVMAEDECNKAKDASNNGSCSGNSVSPAPQKPREYSPSPDEHVLASKPLPDCNANINRGEPSLRFCY